jgi:uncharacterized membrane protein
MNEILATNLINFLQTISLASVIFYATTVFLGSYIVSRLYGFLGVCLYLMAISAISIVLTKLFL